MNIKCPHCGTEYEVEKKDMYRYTKCSVCGKGFVIGATNTASVSYPRAKSPTGSSRMPSNKIKRRMKWRCIFAVCMISALIIAFVLLFSLDSKKEALRTETYDSINLSYSMFEVRELSCEIEKGIINKFKNSMGWSIDIPYDLVAAVMHEFDNKDGNAPSFGVAYKYCRNRVSAENLRFRVRAVYPHKGVLVSYALSDENGLAFVRTDRSDYVVGAELMDGYYILCGIARCRRNIRNSTRFQDFSVKAFREMDVDIAIKRGLRDK